MTAAITGAALNGTSLPLVLNRFGADPAISAGPFVTVINDFSASLIYLASAFLIFKVLI
jgi:magnesium transporter